MAGSDSGLSLLGYLVALALFWLPGGLWARAVHAGERYSPPFLALLGLAWSFAIFSLLAWPFLWLRGSFAGFFAALCWCWLGLTAGGVALAVFRRRRPCVPQTLPGLSGARHFPEKPLHKGGVGPFIVGALVLSAGLGLEYVRLYGGRFGWEWTTGEWRAYGGAVAGLLAASAAAAWWARRRLPPWAALTPEDDRPAPRWAWVLPVGFIVAQAASAVVFDRPDWDDCYYLAAVIDYEQAERLNDQEPTHREGFAVPPHNILQAWELWGATLFHVSGLNPQAAFHTVLPGLFVLLAYAAYGQLLADVLPRRWVPWALLGLAAYHVWGVSSHDTPANYLLTRPGQGKSVLLHLGLPLLAVLAMRYLRGPTWSRGVGLAPGVLFGLAASSSAVFLAVMLLGCLGLAVLASPDWRAALRGFPGLAAVTAMPLAYGLLVRQAILADPALTPPQYLGWSATTWFGYVRSYTTAGCAEVLWLWLLPWLALFLGRGRWTYLVVFPLVLTATFNNPLLCDFVAEHLTTYWNFTRVFWLLPVGVGLGAFVALAGRFVARLVESRWRLPLDPVAGAAVVALLGASWLLPSVYVWSEENVSHFNRWRSHPVAADLLKMPAGLRPLADRLLAETDLSEVRILCDENVSNSLTSYSRRYRFVQTRSLYTLYFLDHAGRREEGERRYLLTLILYGRLPQQPGDKPFQTTHPYYPIGPMPPEPTSLTPEVLRGWLDELRVRYALLETDDRPAAQDKLRQVGFWPVERNDGFTLWSRTLPPG
jgi:hypothetical protein